MVINLVLYELLLELLRLSLRLLEPGVELPAFLSEARVLLSLCV
jgi:hypothetical protein